jgi:hypothetical protein
MGTLQYSSSAQPIVIPNYLLGHLHLVIARRFLRTESFFVAVNRDALARVNCWLDPATPLVLSYAILQNEYIIDSQAVETMLRDSYGADGLQLWPDRPWRLND